MAKEPNIEFSNQNITNNNITLNNNNNLRVGSIFDNYHGLDLNSNSFVVSGTLDSGIVVIGAKLTHIIDSKIPLYNDPLRSIDLNKKVIKDGVINFIPNIA